ncbi:MAG TPA: SDR family oxidoreductase [Candidatus Binataceae bacterium]|nr:SDR family oxidoreductase [Candidatus Binataceae bacterium]
MERVALVTGAGRGIGRAIAIELARAGYSLCIAARNRGELDETRKLSGLAPARALIVLIDLAMDDAPEILIDAVFDRYGRLDVLVNNAGWAPPRTALVKMSTADQDRILAVNLRAPIALARLAAVRMVPKSGAAIINVASSAARLAAPGEAVYAAAKAGLVAFTHAAFSELRAKGIKTSAIVPGLVDTTLIPASKRLNRAAMLRPADVAAAVMHVIESPARVCPAEIVIQPQFDPMSQN